MTKPIPKSDIPIIGPYKGHPRTYPYCEITGQRYLNGCTCNSCKAFWKRRQEAKKVKGTHKMKGCQCPDCVKRREYNRINMNRLYRLHPMKSCQCDWCKKRRANQPRRDAIDKLANRNKAREFKAKVLRELGGKCAICGMVPSHVCQMDLHERNGRIATKVGKSATYNPSKLISCLWGKQLIWKNLDEFIPLCRNCHSLLTCKLCKDKMQVLITNWRRPIVSTQ